ncbi:MAG: ATP-binding protein [Candidatus Roizmanbacteria bacterium]|nr:ATP-binding protein [Candidatus Roizmanbacteria bacterium]
MISREIASQIKKLQSKYPVISITGPRQSGKTTLAQAHFPKHTYSNLENPDIFSLARSDPKSFLKLGSKTKMIIDEVQKLPELLSYIQTEVDVQKIASQYVITGSQNFSLSEKITQSLAGRVANFTLLPLSYRELMKNKHSGDRSVFELMITGFYPAIYDRNIPAKDFYRDYLFTYVERDVRQIVNIGDLSNFQKFLQLLAGRVGQKINFSSLSDDVGVSYKTIDAWISILEASYIVFKLQPYYENFGKRLTKSPKIFFTDTGLLSYLLSIESAKIFENYHLAGSIFENFIISEKMKEIYNRRSLDRLYYWNDNNRNEVDLIVDCGMTKEAVEVKMSKTFSSDFLKGLNYWKHIAKKYKVTQKIIYTGEVEQRIHDAQLLNWKSYVG